MIEESDREMNDLLYADAEEFKRYSKEQERLCDFLVAQVLLRLKPHRIGSGSILIDRDEKICIAKWFEEKHNLTLAEMVDQCRSNIKSELRLNQMRRKAKAEQKLASERKLRERDDAERRKDLL